MQTLWRCLIGVAALALLAAPTLADLITNGSFEEATVGNPPSGAFDTLGAGSTAIKGWTVGGAGIDWIHTYWVNQDGNYSVDMSALNPGTIIQQVVDTVPGTQYALTFYMAGNPVLGPLVKELDVSVPGKTEVFTFDVTGHSQANMGWVKNTVYFTATDSSAAILFQSGTSGPCGPALDDVSLVAIPAPGAIVLGMVGLGLLGVWMRRYA